MTNKTSSVDVNWRGYHRHKEQFCKADGTTITRMVFYVTGFKTDTCNVLMADGTKKEVPIDSKNRITIEGKKYSRKYWNH